MKKIIMCLFILLLCSCNIKEENITDNNQEEIVIGNETNDMKIFINDKNYQIHMEDNDAVKYLYSLLPIEIKMNELNGNEKYAYLDESFPTHSYAPKKIEKGDVMLFGDNCLVIFYKSFNTNYTYTKLGHIDDLDDIGNSSIVLRLEK